MALNTRVEPNIYNYDGINIYSKNGEFLGEITWKQAKTGKVRVSLDVPDFIAVPKAIDNREEKYTYDDDDSIYNG